VENFNNDDVKKMLEMLKEQAESTNNTSNIDTQTTDTSVSTDDDIKDMLKKHFFDTDEMIVNAEGKTIPQIFETEGEKYFRACENVAVNLAGKNTNSVIATGGGVVIRPENYMPLKQNGVIIFINRDVKKLSLDGRPLSQLHGVKELYEQRLPLYRQFADAEVDGNGTVEEVAKSIAKEMLKIENSCN
jgi:shikimate dehydrogenase